jgi:hypothetical protein
MKTLDRRDFLKMAGVGAAAAAVAAGAAVPVAGYFGCTGRNILRFRAVTGMPKAPLPTYASYVIEGQVDIRARTGTLAKSLYAGAQDAMSGVVFPGTARSIRVTNIWQSGAQLKITGELADQAKLLKGESSAFSMLVDRSTGIAQADFLGNPVTMQLDQHS